MKKIIYSAYAVVCYCIFLAVFLYLIGFTSNLFVPKSIDLPMLASPLPAWQAALINVALMALFGLQHSIMARQSFKEKWKTLVPAPVERSTYVLFASSMLILLFLFWQPMPVILWNLTNETTGYIFLAVSALGWGIVLLSTFLINHFHLFGLHQVYQHITGKKEGEPHFRTPFLYKLVRHPLYLGFLIAFWFTPLMTTGHLLFAVVMSIYILIGIYHEEKDLARQFGSRYTDYSKVTPKLIPLGGGKKEIQ